MIKPQIVHRWRTPGTRTMCGRKITPRLVTNVGRYLNEGVTCKACKRARARLSVLGDEWNGQSEGHPKAQDVPQGYNSPGEDRAMRTYSAFSRSAGPQEGAVLVVAHTARAAKRIAWPLWLCWNMDDYTDMAVLWLRDESLLALADQDKLAAGVEHAVESPVGCQSCGLWGCGVDDDGACCHCGEPAGELLAETLRRYIPSQEKEKTMPKPLTADELANRARAELDWAEVAHMETVCYGRAAGRTTRLRAAKSRAYTLLRRAMRKGLSEDEARKIYESAPPDPEFGAAKWTK